MHTGPAVIGNTGSAQRMQYTAIGDTANIAARLVGKPTPGQVIVSEEVRLAARGGDQLRSLGEVELKGRQGKLRFYSVPWEEVDTSDSERCSRSAPL